MSYFGSNERLLLDVQSRVQDTDDHTLVLRFHWRGNTQLHICLEECRLRIPGDLLPVRHVTLGSSSDIDGHREIVWRELELRDQELLLSVTVAKPIRQTNLVLTGSYTLVFNDTSTNAQTKASRIWSGTIYKPAPVAPSFRAMSVVSGVLTLHTQLLHFRDA